MVVALQGSTTTRPTAEKLPLEMETPQCEALEHHSCPGRGTDGFYQITDDTLNKMALLFMGESRLRCTCSCHFQGGRD